MKKLFTFMVLVIFAIAGYSQQLQQPQFLSNQGNNQLNGLNKSLQFYSTNYQDVFKNSQLSIDRYTVDFYDIYKKDKSSIFVPNYTYSSYAITGMPKPGPNLSYNCNKYGNQDFTGAAVGIGIAVGIYTAIFGEE